MSKLKSKGVNGILYISLCSILTLSELEPPVSESSTRTSKFYATSDSEHKFNKTEIEIRLPIGFNLG